MGDCQAKDAGTCADAHENCERTCISFERYPLQDTEWANAPHPVAGGSEVPTSPTSPTAAPACEEP
jgi:hypothetical protein